MRLTQNEIHFIKDAILGYDPKALVFLFGSRINPNAKGGDIDLVVKSELIGLSDKLSILIALKDRLGEQKIDLIVKNKQEFENDSFICSVKKEWVQL